MADLAIIPARGGSKRIPRKNIRDFHGKPIIAYSIQAAVGSGLFSQVMVSTDDEEIADIARKYGSDVPFMRSEYASGDFATTADVLLEVLQMYKNARKTFEYACCIYPTAPFVTPNLLLDAKNMLQKEKFDSVFPVVKYDYPIWRSLQRDAKGHVQLNWPEHINARSQDLPEAWHDAGQFYWFRVDAFLKNKHLMAGKAGGLPVPSTRVQDIDDEDGWKLAELKFQQIRK